MGKAWREIFPLPSNHFAPLELTPAQEAAYRETTRSILAETVDACCEYEDQSDREKKQLYKELRQRDRLTVYRRRKHAMLKKMDRSSGWYYLCVGKLDGTLDEVMNGRYQDTTDSLRRMCAVYRPDLIDCQVLHAIETQSASQPFHFLGFKWMTVMSPAQTVVKNRDVCWLEATGLTTDKYGRETGYAITNSVDLAICPPFDTRHCVRARLCVCYLFRQSEHGGVTVFMRAKAQANGLVMNYITDIKCAEMWMHVHRASQSTYAMIGSALVRAANTSTDLDFRGANHRCEICGDKTKGLLVKRMECSVCHRVTCSRCAIKLRILSPERDFLAKHHAQFCKRCVAFFKDVDLRDPSSLERVAVTAANGGDPISRINDGEFPIGNNSSDASASSHGGSVWSSSDPDSSSMSDQPTPLLAMSQRTAISRAASSASSGSSSSKQQQQPQQQLQLYDHSIALTATSTCSLPSEYGRPHIASTAFSSHSSSVSSSCSDVSYTGSELDDDASLAQQWHAYPTVEELEMAQDGDLDGSSIITHPADQLQHYPSEDAIVYSQHADLYASRQDMMRAMIRMNLMAEKAQKIVQHNSRLASQMG